MTIAQSVKRSTTQQEVNRFATIHAKWMWEMKRRITDKLASLQKDVVWNVAETAVKNAEIRNAEIKLINAKCTWDVAEVILNKLATLQVNVT